MKKIISTFSIIVILLFVLALFGWMVNQVGVHNKKFGFMTEPIKFMYSFPDLFKQSVEEVNTLPKTFVATPVGFKSVNKLEEDINVLTSYSENDSTRTIAIRNLRNDSIVKSWTVNNPFEETARIMHPLYLEDGSIVYYYTYKWELIRIDKNGKQMWKRSGLVFHHGMELNNEGDIWVCTKGPGAYKNGRVYIDGTPYHYMDYTITKFDSETGETLFNKSITELLKENKLENYLLKSHQLVDPLHLNDVQPALKTTELYEEDDLFISLRTISVILHYRPSTNELIKVIEGPFVSQHDVDFLNDSTLSIFNNNFFAGSYKETKEKPEASTKFVDVENYYSSIVTYNLRSGKFSSKGDSIFKANQIWTPTEGIQDFIDENTYFVEEQNQGLLWVIKNDEVVYKDVFRSQHEGYHHLPNWTRVVDLK